MFRLVKLWKHVRKLDKSNHISNLLVNVSDGHGTNTANLQIISKQVYVDPSKPYVQCHLRRCKLSSMKQNEIKWNKLRTSGACDPVMDVDVETWQLSRSLAFRFPKCGLSWSIMVYLYRCLGKSVNPSTFIYQISVLGRLLCVSVPKAHTSSNAQAVAEVSKIGNL